SGPEPLGAGTAFGTGGGFVPWPLRAVRRGGVVVRAGIHMSTIPALEYEPHLFHEKTLRSVEANTRQDGEDLLREASAAGVRPSVTPFPLEAANDALIALKAGRPNRTRVLGVRARAVQPRPSSPPPRAGREGSAARRRSEIRADDELQRGDSSPVDRAQIHRAG